MLAELEDRTLKEKLRRLLKPEWRPFVNHLEWCDLRGNPHKQVQELYLERCEQRPDQIDWFDLARNPHPKAVQMCMDKSNNTINVNRNWWQRGFARNPNPVATKTYLQWANTHLDQVDWAGLSTNSNDEAVDFYLKWAQEHPEQIYWKLFCCNSNDRAVDLCLQWAKANPSSNDWHAFIYNPNPRVVNFCIERMNNEDNVYAFAACSHSKIVDICLSEGTVIDWYSLCFNSHPKAVAICLKRAKQGVFDVHQWKYVSLNPGLFLNFSKMHIMHIWTKCPTCVIYRLPLDLIHMIADFM